MDWILATVFGFAAGFMTNPKSKDHYRSLADRRRRRGRKAIWNRHEGLEPHRRPGPLVEPHEDEAQQSVDVQDLVDHLPPADAELVENLVQQRDDARSMVKTLEERVDSLAESVKTLQATLDASGARSGTSPSSSSTPSQREQELSAENERLLGLVDDYKSLSDGKLDLKALSEKYQMVYAKEAQKVVDEKLKSGNEMARVKIKQAEVKTQEAKDGEERKEEQVKGMAEENDRLAALLEDAHQESAVTIASLEKQIASLNKELEESRRTLGSMSAEDITATNDKSTAASERVTELTGATEAPGSQLSAKATESDGLRRQTVRQDKVHSPETEERKKEIAELREEASRDQQASVVTEMPPTPPPTPPPSPPPQ